MENNLSKTKMNRQFSGGTGTWIDPFQITGKSDLEELADDVEAGNFYDGICFKVMNDINDPLDVVDRMIGNDTYYFQGYFYGGNNKITVDINEDTTNVGLFSQISGGIWDLIIDGQVTGGPNSRNVGGFVGRVLSINTDINANTNLAKVTGTAQNSSVGGFAGAVNSSNWLGFTFVVNNGEITGGFAIGGIFGSANFSNGCVIRDCKNSGTIKSNDDVDISHYMAGIVAHLVVGGGDSHINTNCNIGKVVSGKSMYSGGITAYTANSGIGLELHSNSNSGFVDGAINAIGGIAGYIDNVSVIGCINTNWIAPTATGQNSGAIVGFNNGTVGSCYYDKQMCVLNGIGAGAGGQATPLFTAEMIGYNLQMQGLPGNWVFENNLYPRPLPWDNHPINLLSAAPIYLRDTPLPPPPPRPPFETLNNVQTNFTVSNWDPWPLINPAIPHRYLWGWYDPNGNFNSNSMMGYIDIPINAFPPPPYLNTANIVVPNGGWDALAVRLTNDSIGYEKVVPMNVR